MIISETLIPMHPSFGEIAAFCASGFLLVMFVLAFQTLFTSAIGKIFSAFQQKNNPQTTP